MTFVAQNIKYYRAEQVTSLKYFSLSNKHEPRCLHLLQTLYNPLRQTLQCYQSHSSRIPQMLCHGMLTFDQYTPHFGGARVYTLHPDSGPRKASWSLAVAKRFLKPHSLKRSRKSPFRNRNPERSADSNSTLWVGASKFVVLLCQEIKLQWLN